MDQSKLAASARLLVLVVAAAFGCGRESTTSAGKGGSGNHGGASAGIGGDDEGGSPTAGSATGGASSGAAGSSMGGAGGRIGSGGTNASGGSDSGGAGGASWDMVGGCPSELCPNAGLPEGETCSVTVTCCTHQRLSEGLQGCTCTDGRWVCEPQRCACPG